MGQSGYKDPIHRKKRKSLKMALSSTRQVIHKEEDESTQAPKRDTTTRSDGHHSLKLNSVKIYLAEQQIDFAGLKIVTPGVRPQKIVAPNNRRDR